jgi:fatty acid desaturase
MFRDLYSNLTAREQRALRWSAAAAAVALWLATAWGDPWFLLAVPFAAALFWLYRVRHQNDDPEEDDLDLW